MMINVRKSMINMMMTMMVKNYESETENKCDILVHIMNLVLLVADGIISK